MIVFSSSWSDHLARLEEVLRRVQLAGLTVKEQKYQFAMRECMYLGHSVGSGRVRVEDLKVQAIREFEVPKTKTQVRSFLGLTHSEGTTQFSDTDPGMRYSICETEGRIVFVTKILMCPDFDKQFVLQTDTSDRGVGVVLSQVGDNGLDHPIADFSRKLLPHDEKYSTIEKECLAIKLSIQAFHVYLMGRTFKIQQTKHRSLEWLNRIKDTNARLTWWSLFLQSYCYMVEYRMGRSNGNADALSRTW